MGATAAATRSASQRVVDFGTTHVGKIVGKGSCWDLPLAALQSAGAKTPYDLGNDLYVWGTPINSLKDAQPGDILQFRGVKITTTRTFPNGSWRTDTLDFSELHSAIIQSVDGELFFTTLNAHVRLQGQKTDKRKVQIIRLNLSPENIRSGTITLYRPIPK